MAVAKTPWKHRKTMANLEKELAEQHIIIASLEAFSVSKVDASLTTILEW